MSNILKKCRNYNSIIARDRLKKQLFSLVEHGNERVIVLNSPAGSDKELVADTVVSHILCMQPTQAGACLNCASCRYLSAGTHPDYIEIAPESKNKNIAIADLRDKLQNDVYLMPQIADKRVWRIQGNALREDAQNSLLKVLEEPPSYAYFVITVDDKNSLLETLRSRSRIVDIPRLSKDELSYLLDEKTDVDAASKNIAVNFSAGLAELALNLANDEDLKSDRQKLFKWFIGFPKQSKADLLSKDFDFFMEYKDNYEMSFIFLESFMRDLILLSNLQADELSQEQLFNQDYKNVLINFQNKYAYNNKDLSAAIKALNNTKKRLEANANYKVTLAALLLKLGRIFKI